MDGRTDTKGDLIAMAILNLLVVFGALERHREKLPSGCRIFCGRSEIKNSKSVSGASEGDRSADL